MLLELFLLGLICFLFFLFWFHSMWAFKPFFPLKNKIRLVTWSDNHNWCNSGERGYCFEREKCLPINCGGKRKGLRVNFVILILYYIFNKLFLTFLIFNLNHWFKFFVDLMGKSLRPLEGPEDMKDQCILHLIIIKNGSRLSIRREAK